MCEMLFQSLFGGLRKIRHTVKKTLCLEEYLITSQTASTRKFNLHERKSWHSLADYETQDHKKNM